MSHKKDCPKERQTMQGKHSVGYSLESETYDLIEHTQSTTDLAPDNLEEFIKTKKVEVENQFGDDRAKGATSQMFHSCDAEESIEKTTKHNERTLSDLTHLKLPYFTVCRQRLLKTGKHQRAQFIRELKVHELLRARALDGVRIHREFCNSIFTSVDPKELIVLTKEQKEKIEQILLNARL